jgi:hypothetical protein
MGHPVTEGYEYKDLIFQFGALDARLTTLLPKKKYSCEIKRSGN